MHREVSNAESESALRGEADEEMREMKQCAGERRSKSLVRVDAMRVMH